MNNKITIQDLCSALSTRLGTTRKDADAFVRQFFDVIYEGVLRDKIVKVKGLGTFKLVEVNDRESVNVNTGERIRIPGHSKVSFTPDPVLRDRINKPFADFPTVIINEDTPLAEMERMDDAPIEPQPAPVVTVEEEENVELLVDNAPKAEEAEPSNVIIIGEEHTDAEVPESEPTHVDEPAPIFVTAEESQPDSIEISEASKPIDDNQLEPFDNEVNGDTANEEDSSKCSSWWLRILLVVLVLLLMAGSYVAGYLHIVSLKPLDDIVAKETAVQQPTAEVCADDSTLVDVTDSESTDSISIDDTLPSIPEDSIQSTEPLLQDEAPQPTVPQPKVVPAPKLKPAHPVIPAPDPAAKAATLEQAAQYDQVPGGDYLIVGTRRVHKMQYGDYVTKLARQEYGSKDFVPYIIVHNHLVNADNVVIGAELKLPELRAK